MSEHRFIIYEALNLVNGRVYVGLTTTTLEVRIKSHLRSAKNGSKLYFHKALRKYGPENFQWYPLITTTNLENLYKAEIMVIGGYESWQTYNTSLGGEHSAYGMRHTDETKKICGEYAKKRWDGLRAIDKYPEEVFHCTSYKEARDKYGVPKTTWYRQRKGLTQP